jgi:hypothetical protein
MRITSGLNPLDPATKQREVVELRLKLWEKKIYPELEIGSSKDNPFTEISSPIRDPNSIETRHDIGITDDEYKPHPKKIKVKMEEHETRKKARTHIK